MTQLTSMSIKFGRQTEKDDLNRFFSTLHRLRKLRTIAFDFTNCTMNEKIVEHFWHSLSRIARVENLDIKFPIYFSKLHQNWERFRLSHRNMVSLGKMLIKRRTQLKKIRLEPDIFANKQDCWSFIQIFAYFTSLECFSLQLPWQMKSTQMFPNTALNNNNMWKNLRVLEFTWAPLHKVELQIFLTKVSKLCQLETLHLRLHDFLVPLEIDDCLDFPEVQSIRNLTLYLQDKKWITNAILKRFLSKLVNLRDFHYEYGLPFEHGLHLEDDIFEDENPLPLILPLLENQSATLQNFTFITHEVMALDNFADPQFQKALQNLTQLKNLRFKAVTVALLNIDESSPSVQNINSLPLDLEKFTFEIEQPFKIGLIDMVTRQIANCTNLKELTLIQKTPHMVSGKPLSKLNQFLRKTNQLEKLKLELNLLPVILEELEEFEMSLTPSLKELTFKFIAVSGPILPFYFRLCNRTGLEKIHLGSKLEDEHCALLNMYVRNSNKITSFRFEQPKLP